MIKELFVFIFFVIVSLFTTSCGSFVAGLHQQIEAEENSGKPRQMIQKQSLSQKYRDKFAMKNRINMQNNPSYLPAGKNRKGTVHTKASDLVDNSNANSLWANQDNGVFTTYSKQRKKPGDIIIINVENDMKTDIDAELERVFPKPVPRKKAGSDKDKNAEKKEEPAPAVADSPESSTKQDKISGFIIDTVNADYALVHAKKETIHHNKKRFVDIQALVPYSDILDNTAISSSKMIQVNILVKK